MKLAIEVTRYGTTAKVETLPSDLVAWERHAGRSVTSWSKEAPSYEDVAFLAWRAATRGQTPRPDFDVWLDDGVTDLTLGDVSDGDPTLPGQSPG
jgi:hypothetical protein